MKKFGMVALVFSSAIFFAVTAHAKTWNVDNANSHIAFTGTQGSDHFVGGFTNTNIVVDFDADRPEKGKITATINTRSAFAGSPDRNKALPQPEWFGAAEFPVAIFTSTNIQWDRNPNNPVLKDNIGCYKVTGDLTIKGIKQSVTMPFCIVPEGDYTHARGMLTLMRNDFSVGTAQWADTSFIKNEVTVTVDVVAR